jgi:hypothetical protein
MIKYEIKPEIIAVLVVFFKILQDLSTIFTSLVSKRKRIKMKLRTFSLKFACAVI